MGELGFDIFYWKQVSVPSWNNLFVKNSENNITVLIYAQPMAQNLNNY